MMLEDSISLSPVLFQVWLDVVERASKFLRQVVCGEVSSSTPGPPVEDRHLALALLSELAVQRAELSEMLGLVLLLLSLWRLGSTEDNRHSEGGAASAPLVPLLRRLDSVESDVRQASGQPTQCFLQYADWPEEESCCIACTTAYYYYYYLYRI